MTASTPAVANDTLDVHQLNERVLAWILSVRSAQDLTAQNIARHTGLKFWFNPDNPNDFNASGKLVEPWVYVLGSMETLPRPPPYPVSFEMRFPGNKHADRTQVCIDLDHYRRALTAVGYSASQHPPHAGVESWYFKKDKTRVGVYLRGKTKRYDEQLCVFKVIVGAAQEE